MKRWIVGFTLVEMVIVVVVTVILLVVAVGRFGNAERYAKLARVQLGQRSLATAVESYSIDWAGYPLSAYPTKNAAAGEMTFRAFAILTTPVAYVTYIEVDEYAERAARGKSNGWRNGSQDPFIFYSGNALDTSASQPTSLRNFWILVSVGPDGRNDMSVDGTDPVAAPDPVRTPYSLDPCDIAVMLKGGTTVQAPTSVRAADGGAWTDVAYDPSNGTYSKGDILKFNSGAALPRFISR
jgi:type II secretory pathway pseudopilin PulG